MKRSQEGRLEEVRGVIRRAMRQWRVPGLAAAVVRGGRTVLAEGFGLRDARRGLPVTAQTLFAVGSVTKAFTATAVGVLVDEGRLTWDTPVRDVFAGFRLRDPVATERATIRDLLCHRTGLPRHDNVWYGATGGRRELADRLRHLEPSKDFRAAWQYQNLMYMVAGMVVEAATGTTWEAFVAERICRPLGMSGVTFTTAEAQGSDDFALPYRRRGGRAVRTPFYALGPMAPAGGIYVGAGDMARWLGLNLLGGRRGRRRIVSVGTLAEIHRPQAVVPDQPKWPELCPLTYGLGWNVHSYRGRPCLTHGGLINGFQAGIGLLPTEGIGAVVLTNLMGQPVPMLAIYSAFDRLLGLKPLPWPARMRRAAAAERKAQAAAKGKGARARRRGPARRPRPLAEYVGEYEHAGYGVLEVRRDGNRLRAVWNGIAHALRRRRADVFELHRPLWASKQELSFLADAEGRIDRASAPFEPAVGPIVFTRRTGGKPGKS